MVDQLSDAISKVVIVTDPMCSWCWGMTADFEIARRKLKDTVAFDFLLGGINTHGTQSIGDYGRRFLMKLWHEVEETTGQSFGFKLPDDYVHNSVLPCLAVERVRDESLEQAFDFLHRLQERFFMQGANINDLEFLQREVVDYGVSADDLARSVQDPGYRERVRFQFENATHFGTQALPSLLVEKGGALSLLAGGYVDAEMLETLVRSASRGT